MWPNFRERRVWSLIFSYALPAISPGPVLTILALYLGQGLHLTQAQVNSVVWIPPLTWGIGYFFWGWAADKFAATNTRPVGHVPAAHRGLAHARLRHLDHLAGASPSRSSRSRPSSAAGSRWWRSRPGRSQFPREQSAMMTGIASGSWSLVNFVLLKPSAPADHRGVRSSGPNWMNAQRWDQIFWLIALLPAVGIGLWMALNAGAPKTATT